MISKAPARICLFGDHQDYLGLPVIACAINKYMVVEGVPNNTNYLLFSLIDFDQVIKLNPNYTDAHVNRGMACFKMNKLDEACISWSNGKKLGATNVDGFLMSYCQ